MPRSSLPAWTILLTAGLIAGPAPALAQASGTDAHGGGPDMPRGQMPGSSMHQPPENGEGRPMEMMPPEAMQRMMSGAGAMMMHPGQGITIIINPPAGVGAYHGGMGRHSMMDRQPGMGGSGMMGPHGTAGGEEDGPERSFRSMMDRMHRAMSVTLTGDTDADFARAMIPHHQGAIEMARLVLERGSDPEIRRLAEEVIAAQEKEITMLREWLARNPQR